MKFSEETLMAYADRQLDADTHAAVEAAMVTDPDLAQRVARHQALAESVRASFDPVLQETVPHRLLDAIAGDADRRSADVIDIVPLRQEKHSRKTQRWSWPQWGAMAASLIMGSIVGRFSSPDSEPALFTMDHGRVVAHGALEHALSAQLVNAQPDNAPVRIGFSLVAKSGEYCRTFALAQGLAGLACKTDNNWRLPIMAQSTAATAPPEVYHMAESDMPPAVMREVEAEISGTTLDASEEQSALQRGWHR